MTPLHYAVLVENEDIIVKLIAKGADPNIKDNTGEDVLYMATPSVRQLIQQNQQ